MKTSVSSYRAGTCACENGEQWQRALVLLSEPGEGKLNPDVISYSVGISIFVGMALNCSGLLRCSASFGKRS